MIFTTSIILFLLIYAIAILLLRRRSLKKKPNRAWYDTNYYFFDFKCVEPSGNAAWVTSCNANYIKGVMKLHKSIQNVNSKFPLICFYTNSITKDQEKLLSNKGIITLPIDLNSLYNPYKQKWHEAFVKLECWRLIDYEKVCWIDSDTIQLQNCDELMNIPIKLHGIACAVDHEVFPSLFERVRFKMIQTGVFTLVPSLQTYEIIKSQLGKLESIDGSDQGFLTSFFALSYFENVRFISSAYNYMKRGIHRHKSFDLTRIKILHFVGHPKPWEGGEPGYEKLQKMWDKL